MAYDSSHFRCLQGKRQHTYTTLKCGTSWNSEVNHHIWCNCNQLQCVRSVKSSTSQSVKRGHSYLTPLSLIHSINPTTTQPSTPPTTSQLLLQVVKEEETGQFVVHEATRISWLYDWIPLSCVILDHPKQEKLATLTKGWKTIRDTHRKRSKKKLIWRTCGNLSNLGRN